jgi:hypothetical protein
LDSFFTSCCLLNSKNTFVLWDLWFWWPLLQSWNDPPYSESGILKLEAKHSLETSAISTIPHSDISWKTANFISENSYHANIFFKSYTSTNVVVVVSSSFEYDLTDVATGVYERTVLDCPERNVEKVYYFICNNLVWEISWKKSEVQFLEACCGTNVQPHIMLPLNTV